MPVLSVTESQTVDLAGNLKDVYEVVFTFADKPGSFTVIVDKGPDAVGRARALVDETIATVSAIYDFST